MIVQSRKRTRGGTMLMAAVALAALAAFAGCGGGSSDSSAPDAESATEEPTGESTNTESDAGGEEPVAVSEEMCEAAAPLFDTLEKIAYTNEEVPAMRASIAAALTELAELSEGETAQSFTDMAEEVKADDAGWFPGEAHKLLAGCAESTLDLVVSEDGIADLPATVPSGLTALTVSNPGEDTAYVVMSAGEEDDVQDVRDQLEFGGEVLPAAFAERSQDGSTRLFVLEPGRYGVVAFTSTGMDPNEQAAIPGVEFVRIIEAE